MLGNREEAEDVLQHVFLAVHRTLRADDRPVRLKPWLYAVARNRCLSVLRSRREAVALDDVAEPSTDGLAVAAEVEQRQDLRHLLADLADLPEDQRAALLLAELGDLSHEEIGEALEVRRDKVKALVFQARESLMSTRAAREADCREIQQQLATLTGAALRRGPLRRHVAVCPDCAAFKAEVRRQRTALAMLLPVVPGVTLKTGIFAGIIGGGGGGVVAGGGLVAGSAAIAGGSSGGLLGGLTGKALVVAAVATGGGTGYVAVREVEHHDRGTAQEAVAEAATVPDEPAARAATPPRAPTPSPAARAVPVSDKAEQAQSRRGRRAASERRRRTRAPARSERRDERKQGRRAHGHSEHNREGDHGEGETAGRGATADPEALAQDWRRLHKQAKAQRKAGDDDHHGDDAPKLKPRPATDEGDDGGDAVDD
jgi:RNA polymerase sigma factor (sigma-70 family)